MTLRYHKKYALIFSWNNRPWCKIRQIDSYQIQTVNIRQGLFFIYRFHISCIVRNEYIGNISWFWSLEKPEICCRTQKVSSGCDVVFRYHRKIRHLIVEHNCRSPGHASIKNTYQGLCGNGHYPFFHLTLCFYCWYLTTKISCLISPT